MITTIWHQPLYQREAEVSVIYVFSNLVWPLNDLMKIEMALDRNKIPHPWFTSFWK